MGKLLVVLGSLAIVIVIAYGISTVVISFAKKHKINIRGLTSPKIIRVVEPIRLVTSKVVITTLATGEVVVNKVVKPTIAGFRYVHYVKRSKKEEKLRKELAEMEELHRQEIEHFDAQHEFTDFMD